MYFFNFAQSNSTSSSKERIYKKGEIQQRCLFYAASCGIGWSWRRKNHYVKYTNHNKGQKYYFFHRECFTQQEVTQHNTTNWWEIVDYSDYSDLNVSGSNEVYNVCNCALNWAETNRENVTLTYTIVKNRLNVLVHHAKHDKSCPSGAHYQHLVRWHFQINISGIMSY